MTLNPSAKPSPANPKAPRRRSGWLLFFLIALTAAPSAGQSTDPAAPTPQEGDVLRRDVLPQPHLPEVGEYVSYNRRASLLRRGQLVYNDYCIGCHGVNGDGHGPAAVRLITKPRDFTKGIFKFRSTDSSSLPMETDLHRTITRGLARVSMPAFPLMSERDKLAVIEYVKSFYPNWEKEKGARNRVFVPQAPQDLHEQDRVKRGRIVYVAMQCGKCHGIDGAGKGATQTEYTDVWGNPQKAFDFTLGRLKGGDDPEDIYRTFHTGLRSIMPSFGGVTLATVNQETFNTQTAFMEPGEAEKLAPWLEAFAKTPTEIFVEMDDKKRAELVERNSWDLVAYVRSLKRQAPSANPAPAAQDQP